MTSIKNYYKKVNKAASKFTAREWIAFETSVIAFTLMLISLIPALLRISLWAYVAIFIIIYLYFLRKISPRMKKRNEKGFIPRFSKIAHKFKFFDRAIYKIAIITFTLALAAFIPELSVLHRAIYGGMFIALSSYLTIHVLHEGK